jgi:16S rRNA (uracil1498-N3)-methyltransferase
MKLHRFYVGARTDRSVQCFGEQRMWTDDKVLLHQWQNVLRFRVGEKVSIFDDTAEFIYEITEFSKKEIALKKITEVERKLPRNQVLLAWSLIKKNNNDLVLQKCTELGVTHFVPLGAERSERTGLNIDRATKIVIEAAEQCGRADIPIIEDTLSPKECIERFKDHYELYVTNMDGQSYQPNRDKPVGILVGPEGGWSEGEAELFNSQKVAVIKISDHTLRAETAAIVAAHALQ